MVIKLSEADRRTYSSVNLVIIASDSGFSVARHQAIIWTNADL